MVTASPSAGVGLRSHVAGGASSSGLGAIIVANCWSNPLLIMSKLLETSRRITCWLTSRSLRICWTSSP